MALPLVGTAVTIGSGLRPRQAWAEGLPGVILADRRHRFDAAHTPVGLAVAVGAAGNVNVGLHEWVVAFLAGTVRLRPSAPVTLTVVTAAKKVNLTLPLGPADVTSRAIYRTVAGDATHAYKLVGTVGNNTATTFEDNVADSGLGAALAPAEKVGPAALSVRVRATRPGGLFTALTLPIGKIS